MGYDTGLKDGESEVSQYTKSEKQNAYTTARKAYDPSSAVRNLPLQSGSGRSSYLKYKVEEENEMER
jgi:hypothetical protein